MIIVRLSEGEVEDALREYIKQKWINPNYVNSAAVSWSTLGNSGVEVRHRAKIEAAVRLIIPWDQMKVGDECLVPFVDALDTEFKEPVEGIDKMSWWSRVSVAASVRKRHGESYTTHKIKEGFLITRIK